MVVIVDTVRVAMVQMHVEGGDPEANIDRAAAAIAEAAAMGARIAVLPECLDLGWTHPSARELAEPIPGGPSERLAAAAADDSIYVVAGLVERSGERIYNSAILIDPQGTLLHVHRKINELDIATDLYSTGDRLAVTDTEFGRLGVNICADNLPGSSMLGHALGKMGARMLLSPSAWAVDADHDNERDPYRVWHQPYRELALAHSMTVIGVSSVGWMTAGPWQGRKTIGCSLAVGPDGEVLAQAPYGVDAQCSLMVEVPID